MKELFQKIYDKITHFPPLYHKSDNNINHTDGFPVVGFLDKERVKELELVLSIKISNPRIYEQALTHRSYMHVLGADSGCRSNERLEFLGDSVLGIIVSDFLFFENVDFLEGQLTKMRSWLVNKNSLAYCAKMFGLEKFVMLSFSAEKAMKGGSDSILADALEAIIAAIYIDSGFIDAKKFVLTRLIPLLLNQSILEDKNYKSILLEKVQAVGHISPKYIVHEEKGPDHEKEFIVGVYVDNALVGTGKGKSKKQAEQQAALNALENNEFSNKLESQNGKVNI